MLLSGEENMQIQQPAEWCQRRGENLGERLEDLKGVRASQVTT